MWALRSQAWGLYNSGLPSESQAVLPKCLMPEKVGHSVAKASSQTDGSLHNRPCPGVLFSWKEKEGREFMVTESLQILSISVLLPGGQNMFLYSHFTDEKANTQGYS